MTLIPKSLSKQRAEICSTAQSPELCTLHSLTLNCKLLKYPQYALAKLSEGAPALIEILLVVGGEEKDCFTNKQDDLKLGTVLERGQATPRSQTLKKD